jgi:hypothetical protein
MTKKEQKIAFVKFYQTLSLSKELGEKTVAVIGDHNCAFRAILQSLLLQGILIATDVQKDNIVHFLKKIYNTHAAQVANTRISLGFAEFNNFIKAFYQATILDKSFEIFFNEHFPTQTNPEDINIYLLPQNDQILKTLAFCLRLDLIQSLEDQIIEAGIIKDIRDEKAKMLEEHIFFDLAKFYPEVNYYLQQQHLGLDFFKLPSYPGNNNFITALIAVAPKDFLAHGQAFENNYLVLFTSQIFKAALQLANLYDPYENIEKYLNRYMPSTNILLILCQEPSNGTWLPKIINPIDGCLQILSYETVPIDTYTGFLIEKCGSATRLLFYDTRTSTAIMDEHLAVFCHVAEVTDYALPSGKKDVLFPSLIPNVGMVLASDIRQELRDHWEYINKSTVVPAIVIPEEQWLAQQRYLQNQITINVQIQQTAQNLIYTATQVTQHLSQELRKKEHELTAIKEQIKQHEQHSFFPDLSDDSFTIASRSSPSTISFMRTPRSTPTNFMRTPRSSPSNSISSPIPFIDESIHADLGEAETPPFKNNTDSVKASMKNPSAKPLLQKNMHKEQKHHELQDLSEQFNQYLESFDKSLQNIYSFFNQEDLCNKNLEFWTKFFQQATNLTIFQCQKLLLKRNQRNAAKITKIPNRVKEALLHRLLEYSNQEYDSLERQDKYLNIASQVSTDRDLKKKIKTQYQEHLKRKPNLLATTHDTFIFSRPIDLSGKKLDFTSDNEDEDHIANIFAALNKPDIKLAELRPYFKMMHEANHEGQIPLMLSIKNKLNSDIIRSFITKTEKTIAKTDAKNNSVMHYWAKYQHDNMSFFKELYTAYFKQINIQKQSEQQQASSYIELLQNDDGKTFLHILIEQNISAKQMEKVLTFMLQDTEQSNINMALIAKDNTNNNIYNLVELKPQDWFTVKKIIRQKCITTLKDATEENFSKENPLISNENLLDFFGNEHSNLPFYINSNKIKELKEIIHNRMYIRAHLQSSCNYELEQILERNDFTAIIYNLLDQSSTSDNTDYASIYNIINICLEIEEGFESNSEQYLKSHPNLLQCILKDTADSKTSIENAKIVINYILQKLGTNQKNSILNHQDPLNEHCLFNVIDILNCNGNADTANLLQIFIDNGACLSIVNKMNQNILHFACEHNKPQAIEILLEKIATLDIQEQANILTTPGGLDHETPLRIAKNTFEPTEENIKILDKFEAISKDALKHKLKLTSKPT